jgi:hypothetical protein
MKIDEVVETPEGTIQFKAELDNTQVTAMVRWFIHHLVATGAATIINESQIAKGTDTLQ